MSTETIKDDILTLFNVISHYFSSHFLFNSINLILGSASTCLFPIFNIPIIVQDQDGQNSNIPIVQILLFNSIMNFLKNIPISFYLRDN